MQANSTFDKLSSLSISHWREIASKGLILLIVALGLAGVFSPYEYNILPANSLLELAFLLLSILFFPPRDLVVRVLMAFAIIYLGITAFIAIVVNDTHLLDYLQAYKAFVYAALLCSFIGKNLVSLKNVTHFFYILIFLFLVKYLYSRVIGLDAWVSERPGIFTENNFELVFLTLIFYLVLPYIRWRAVLFLLLMFVVFLSASRSAFLCLLVVYFFSIFRLGKTFLLKWLLMMPLLLFVGYGVVSDRMDISFGGFGGGGATTSDSETVAPVLPDSNTISVPPHENISTAKNDFRSILEKGASIDRVRFLLYFLDDTENWRWWNYLLGTEPLTPLSVDTCEALSYWNDLFSFSGDGRCYSVILHSYIIRVIYDHGLLGLIFLVGFTAVALRKSGYSWADVLCVLGVLLASSLSVSAFNSIFATLSVVFYLIIKKPSMQDATK